MPFGKGRKIELPEEIHKETPALSEVFSSLVLLRFCMSESGFSQVLLFFGLLYRENRNPDASIAQKSPRVKNRSEFLLNFSPNYGILVLRKYYPVFVWIPE